MSRVQNDADFKEYDAFGLNPKAGFKFATVGAIWVMVTVAPMLLALSSGLLFMAGLSYSHELLWLFAPLGILCIWWLLAVLVWLQYRGWGSAIQEIEKKRRQGDTWGPTPLPAKAKREPRKRVK